MSAPSTSNATTLHAMSPTRLIGGVGILDSTGTWASTYGRRALVVVGERHARASGVLARIETSLRANGVDVELLEGVPGDPSVTVVEAGSQLARHARCDVIVGVGGGSVLDVAKAIAIAACRDAASGEFRSLLSGARAPGVVIDAALPVVAVPTLIGSGSETNGTCVISDDRTGAKWSAHADVAAPRVALLDPAMLDDTPSELLGPGLVDAMCHALEAGMSIRSSIASDAAAEQAVRMLRRSLRDALALTDAPVDRAAQHVSRQACWVASNLASQALTWAGSAATHPLAHALGAAFGVRHGEAVAAIEPAVIVTWASQLHDSGRLAKLARWLELRVAAHQDETVLLAGVLGRFGTLCREARVTRGLAAHGVEPAVVSELVRTAVASNSRGLAAMSGEPATADELMLALDRALRHDPTDAARSWMAPLDAPTNE